MIRIRSWRADEKIFVFKIAGQLICILATALFLFPLVLMLIRSLRGACILCKGF